MKGRTLPVAIALTALVLAGAAIADVATSGGHSATPVQIVQRADATSPTTTPAATSSTPTTGAAAPESIPAASSAAPAASGGSSSAAAVTPIAAPQTASAAASATPTTEPAPTTTTVPPGPYCAGSLAADESAAPWPPTGQQPADGTFQSPPCTDSVGTFIDGGQVIDPAGSPIDTAPGWYRS